MGKKDGVANGVFNTLLGRDEIRCMERSRSPCGGAKRRIKIVRDPAIAKVILTVTEPDFPSSSIEITTSNVPATVQCIEAYARKQGVDVLTK